MNVLHVTLSFCQGGRRVAIASLCDGLRPLGVINRLCCLDDFSADASERDGYFTDAIELRRRGLFDREALRRLAAFCRTHAIDVLHCHDAASQATCAIALPRRPPMLMTFHRTRNIESARRRDRMRNALAGLRTDRVVAATEQRRQHYLKHNHISSGKVLAIPIGIDLSSFRPDAEPRAKVRARLGLNDEQVLIGVVGHFGPEKGVDLAIDTFQTLRRTHPALDTVLVVLGEGQPDQERFVRARVQPDCADRIHFVGFQNTPEQWFPGFDVLLHGARNEAFGLVLVEAMACGVPVVAAAVGGIPEVIRDGETGLLVANPETTALAMALASLLSTEGLLSKMATACVEHARKTYDHATYARRYFELYRELTGCGSVRE